MDIDLSIAGIEQLIDAGESEHVELKATVPPDHVIAKQIVAFANTEGGVILFGVADKNELPGIPQNRLEEDIARLTRVTKTLLAYAAELRSLEFRGKNLISLSIPRAPESLRPMTTARGEIYIRQGDRIVQDKGAQQWRQEHSGPKKVFVAMSFREEEEPALVDYYHAMQRACDEVGGLKLTRMNLVEGDYEISQGILDAIDQADIVIADFTLNSRNVYFELGYCRGRKKVIIQTARQDAVLEFDVRNWRTLIYRNATELEKKLVSALANAANKCGGSGPEETLRSAP